MTEVTASAKRVATMKRNKKAAVEQRREKVAQLSLRGLSQRAISQALAKMGIVNPKTGLAYDVAQINRDLKLLSKQWQRKALDTTHEHKSRQYMELQELKRKAWTDNNLPVVLNAIKAEMELLGTKAPEQVNADISINFGWSRLGDENNQHLNERTTLPKAIQHDHLSG